MKKVRESLRVHPAILWGVMLGCAVLLLVLFWPLRLIIFQVAALLGIGLGFRHWPPVQAWFGHMARPHRWVFGLLFLAVLAGHFSLDSRSYFPFLPWQIFARAREDNPVTCREFIGTTIHGRNVRLLVEQLFPSIVQFNPPDDMDSDDMSRLIHALARQYNDLHPAEPLRSLDLTAMSVYLRGAPPTPSENTPACELRYDVSSDRSN